jgi:hypothetical protein
MFALPEYIKEFNNSQGGNETVPLWGSVIDMGGETNLKRPQFFALQLANSAILPTMLATTVSGANPTWNQPLSTNDSIQLASAHDLQSFAFTNGTQNSVVIFNLSRTGSLPITFSGSNAPSGNVVISQLTSTNPTDNNEGLFTGNPVVAGPTQTNVSNFNPATPYSLPPYSMTVFSSGGAALPASTTTLQASPTLAGTGQNVTLTAQITSQSGAYTPTGTVIFYNGSISLGTASLASSGKAIFSTTTLPAGTDSITASYGGDSNDAGSTSQPVNVTITSAATATTTVLTSSATAINAGQNVTFSVTITPQSGSNVPTGTVTFLDGATTLGTGTVNTAGVATLSTTSLAAGIHSITASYGGDDKNGSSLSQAVTVNVTTALPSAVATTTTLTASATQITVGQNEIFTAQVSPQTGSGVATGMVNFLDGSTSVGSTQLNTSGAATFTTNSLAAGSHSITASYSGDTNDSPSTSSPITVNVAAASPAYAMLVSSSSVNLNPGTGATLMVTLIPENGFALPISLSCLGLPKGMSCGFTPSTVTPNGGPVTSNVTIMTTQQSAGMTSVPDETRRGRLVLGWAMPWGLIPLLGLAKRRNRSRLAEWLYRLAIAAGLIAGSMWLTGCGYSGTFTGVAVTINATAPNAETHSSLIIVRVQP